MIYEKPFRHAVIDGFLSPEKVEAINREWPKDWHKEDGKGARKWSSERLPPSALAVALSVTPEWVGEITGISGLFADPDLFGAGLHCIPKGGYLKMHVDFNVHPNGWHRRVNVLIYLNQRWKPQWGGALQLGIGFEAKAIDPIGGRCVIFDTNDQSWHGHPDPLRCPRTVQRRSLALYFYTKEPPQAEPHTTIYQRQRV